MLRLFGGLAAAIGLMSVVAVKGLPGDLPLGDAPVVAAGVEAYKSGDHAALVRIIETYQAAHPAVEASAADDPCTPSAFAHRREKYVQALLKGLDKPIVFSMSEEARLVYLDANIFGAPMDEVPPDFEARCSKTTLFTPLRLQDSLERMGAIKSMMVQRKAWWDDLTLRHGDNLGRRMQRGANLVAAYDLPTGVWNPEQRAVKTGFE